MEPILPPAKEGGRPRTTDLREVINAFLYMLHNGCQWDLLPNDFPPKSTVYEYYSQWASDGTFDEMVNKLREKVRVKAGRNPMPSAAIIELQSVKIAGPAIEFGYDGAKQIKVRKRHVALDIIGLLLTVVVHSAGIAERAGAKLVLAKLMSYFTGIKIIWADGSYSGKAFKAWVKEIFNIIWQFVKRA